MNWVIVSESRYGGLPITASKPPAEAKTLLNSRRQSNTLTLVRVSSSGAQWLMVKEVWLYQCVPAPDVTGEIGQGTFRLALQDLEKQ